MANEKRLIDAYALINLYCDGCSAKAQGCIPFDDPVCGTVQLVHEVPTVDAVEVVHGRWLIHKGHFHDYAECSYCGEDYGKDTAMAFNYCPNCGAKMDGDGNA